MTEPAERTEADPNDHLWAERFWTAYYRSGVPACIEDELERWPSVQALFEADAARFADRAGFVSLEQGLYRRPSLEVILDAGRHAGAVVSRPEPLRPQVVVRIAFGAFGWLRHGPRLSTAAHGPSVSIDIFVNTSRADRAALFRSAGSR